MDDRYFSPSQLMWFPAPFSDIIAAVHIFACQIIHSAKLYRVYQIISWREELYRIHRLSVATLPNKGQGQGPSGDAEQR